MGPYGPMQAREGGIFRGNPVRRIPQMATFWSNFARFGSKACNACSHGRSSALHAVEAVHASSQSSNAVRIWPMSRPRLLDTSVGPGPGSVRTAPPDPSGPDFCDVGPGCVRDLVVQCVGPVGAHFGLGECGFCCDVPPAARRSTDPGCPESCRDSDGAAKQVRFVVPKVYRTCIGPWSGLPGTGDIILPGFVELWAGHGGLSGAVLSRDSGATSPSSSMAEMVSSVPSSICNCVDGQL